MKRSSTVFLQFALVALGIGALALLLREPWIEGVNANVTSAYEIYNDPFLWLIYAGSIPFFIALGQAFKLLGYIGRDEVFSPGAIRTLRTIKYCALAIIAFVAVEEIVIAFTHGNDDSAGAVAMGVFIIFGSIVAATGAAVFERMLQSAVDLKSENDLTV